MLRSRNVGQRISNQRYVPVAVHSPYSPDLRLRDSILFLFPPGIEMESVDGEMPNTDGGHIITLSFIPASLYCLLWTLTWLHITDGLNESYLYVTWCHLVTVCFINRSMMGISKSRCVPLSD